MKLHRTIGNQAVQRLLLQRQELEEEERLQGESEAARPNQQPAPHLNRTGLPDNLKAGIENLASISMDQVKVHFNSSQPGQLNALAYTQGADIHLAPGQEQHLPHEAWHVVQQAQGRVKPTMQLKDGTPVNDDQRLEHEADVMGAKALQVRRADQAMYPPIAQATAREARDRAFPIDAPGVRGEVVQRVIEKTLEVARGADTIEYKVKWEKDGKLSDVTVNDKKPSTAFLRGTDFFETVNGIADVKLDPTGFSVLVFPKEAMHGIWIIQPMDGGYSWSLRGGTETRGAWWWKTTVAKSARMLVGIEGMDKAADIAGKTFDNMRAVLSYKLGESPGVDGIIGGAKKGECDAINGALGVIIQAALASRGVDADVKKVATQTPFVTQDTNRSATSVIKGRYTNIYTQGGAAYNGHRIKFDNHGWVTVGGQVYDLVAGIRGGAVSCVDQELKVVTADKVFEWGKNRLTKIEPAEKRDPWTSGYDWTETA